MVRVKLELRLPNEVCITVSGVVKPEELFLSCETYPRTNTLNLCVDVRVSTGYVFLSVFTHTAERDRKKMY